MAQPRLILTRRIAAPRSAVYRAWTDPEIMRSWLGPDNFECTENTGEVRVGGPWHSVIHDRATGELHPSSGTYCEVVPDRKLAFTFRWDGSDELETVCTVELTDDDSATLMTFTQEPFADDASRDGHAGGWSEAFGKLERVASEASATNLRRFP